MILFGKEALMHPYCDVVYWEMVTRNKWGSTERLVGLYRRIWSEKTR